MIETFSMPKKHLWISMVVAAMLLSVLFISARVSRYLVDAFMLTWVLREVFGWMRSALDGRASTYPQGWKLARRIFVRTLQVVIALAMLTVSGIAVRSIHNDILSSGWMPSESSANRLFVALTATVFFFSSMTPRQWSMRNFGEFALGIGFILGLACFVPYVPEGSY
jgi:hypothetical protein